MKRGRVDVAPAPAAIEQDDEVFEDPFIGLNTPAFEGGLQMRTTVGVGESDRPVASQGDDSGTWSDLDVDVDDDDDDDDNEKGGKDDGAARDAVKRVKQAAKDAAANAAANAAAAAVASTLVAREKMREDDPDKDEGAMDEASLPPWMRAAAASIIPPKTPSASALGLDTRLVATLRQMGVRRCFPVQAAVIPVVLAAHAARCAADMCVCAPTGSGKTLAYALPVVQALLPRVVPRLRALVILPTRGLAAQVHKVFASLCEGTPLRAGLAAGHDGLSLERERAALLRDGGVVSGGARMPSPPATSGASAVDILVATPGRLVEHLQQASSGDDAAASGFTLEHLRWLVVDEADRLLSAGYQGWLELVLDAAHTATTSPDAASAMGAVGLGAARTQRARLGSVASRARGAPLRLSVSDPPLLKLLFSATLTRSAAKLAPLRLNRPRYFCVAGARYATPSTLLEWMLTCNNAREKPKLLVRLLQQLVEGVDVSAWALDADGGSEDGDDHEEQNDDDGDDGRAMVDDEDGDEEDSQEQGEEEDDDEGEEGEEGGSGDEEEGEEDEEALDSEGRPAVQDTAESSRTRQLLLNAKSAAKRSGSGVARRPSHTAVGKAIVFASSLESTHRLTRLIQLLMPSVDAREFSSSVPPRERTAILQDFAAPAPTASNSSAPPLRLLIASDAMARGMDVEGVTAVINYDPPANIKAYVHRVGRTARAGKAGTSYTLLRSAEVHHFKKMMAKASKPWRPLELPRSEPHEVAALDGAYEAALDSVQWVLAQERANALAPTAPREALAALLETRGAGG